MKVALVIDSTLRYDVAWDGSATALRRQIQQWMTRGDPVVVRLSDGGDVMVNFQTVTTVQVEG